MDADQVRRRLLAAGVLVFLSSLVPLAAAHGGGLSEAQTDSLRIPFWLFLTTGGGVVGASFLLASFATDRELLAAIHDWRARLPVPEGVLSASGRVGPALGVAVLAAVVATSVLGPQRPRANLAVLVVWAGWWAGVTMVVYLVGNVWAVVNPWSALARALDVRGGLVAYPDRLGAWPSVVGLLALVWLEVVSPVAEHPTLLGIVVVGYTLATVAGAVLVGAEPWFRNVDPVARVFRFYGRVAPVRRSDDGLEIALPAARLTDPDVVDGRDDVAFVVAILWVTTYDGLVSTPTWAGVTRWVVGLGVPALVAYLGTLVVGFGVFVAVYRLAVTYARRYAETYRSADDLLAALTPSLLPIAVGYHLAHFLGYFLQLLPALVASLTHPLSVPPLVVVLVLPPWFGVVPIAFVLVGHLVAVWVAHAASFELFPHRVQAIRSQYPLVAAMVFYTMVSLWIVSRPSVPLPYL